MIHNQLRGFFGLPEAWRIVTGGSEIGLERAGETLTPNLDLWSRIEFALPRDEVWFAQIGNAPAVAAENGISAILNPLGSGLLAVVFAGVRAGAAAAWQFGIALNSVVQGTLALASQPTGLDGRRAIGPAGVLQGCGLELWQGTDPGGVNTVNLMQTNTPAASDQNRYFVQPVVIKPGQSAAVQGTTVNLAGTIDWWGYVRKANVLELSP